MISRAGRLRALVAREDDGALRSAQNVSPARSALRECRPRSKISYPTENQVEHHLAVDKKVDVYGIYFDFASDTRRPESEPVLREIARRSPATPSGR